MITSRRTALALTLAVPLTLTACNSDDDSADETKTTTNETNTPQETFEKEENQAEIGQPLSVNGAEITPTNLRPGGRAEQEHTCVDVSIEVASDAEPLDIHGLAEWKLYDPSNTARLQTANEDTRNLPDVIEPGQEVQGTVCFENTPGDPGDYQLRFRGDTDPLANDAVWTGRL